MNNQISLIPKSNNHETTPNVVNKKCKKYGAFSNKTYLERLLKEIKKITDLKGPDRSAAGSFLIAYTLELDDINKEIVNKNSYTINTYNDLKLKAKESSNKKMKEAERIKELLEKIKERCIDPSPSIRVRPTGSISSAGKKRKVNDSKKNKKRKSRGKRLKKTKRR